MFISVSEAKGRFTFFVGDDPADNPMAHFWSLSDAHLVSGLKQDYASFGEAHACASKLVTSRPFHVMAKRLVFYKTAQDSFMQVLSPEDASVAHFNELLDLVEGRLEGIETLEDKERGEVASAVSNELEGIVGDVNALLELIGDDRETDEMRKDLQDTLARAENLKESRKLGKSLAKQAQQSSPNMSDLSKGTVVAFGEAAFKSILPIHPRAFLKRVEFDESKGIFDAYISEQTEAGVKDLVSLRFGDNLLLFDVLPASSIKSECPLHSKSFFTRYWKPIVTAVGHIAPPGHGVVVVPSSNLGAKDFMPGFDVTSGQKKSLNVVFSGSDNSCWRLVSGNVKTAASDFSEGELKEGEEVRCVNNRLSSCFGRTGTVVRVVPRRDYADVTVDFRRGLGEVVLTDKDLKRVVLPPSQSHEAS